MKPGKCSKCGTVVTSGLRLCVTCALRHGEGPKFTLQLGPQKRPPYEQQLPTTENDE